MRVEQPVCLAPQIAVHLCGVVSLDTAQRRDWNTPPQTFAAHHLKYGLLRQRSPAPIRFSNLCRVSLGHLIGKIGFSHWWSVEKVAAEFSTPRGASLSIPPDWTIDPLRLACILRLVDAAHLDWRRAPGFLRALLKPVGVAAEHWNFQEHLNQPILEDDRLVYTANQPFDISEARSWWLCLDTLRSVDVELRNVDALFADRKMTRFAARVW